MADIKLFRQKAKLHLKLATRGYNKKLPIFVFGFFFFGQGIQQLDVGSQFPDQALNPGRCGLSAKSYPLEYQGNLPIFDTQILNSYNVILTEHIVIMKLCVINI